MHKTIMLWWTGTNDPLALALADPGAIVGVLLLEIVMIGLLGQFIWLARRYKDAGRRSLGLLALCSFPVLLSGSILLILLSETRELPVKKAQMLREMIVREDLLIEPTFTAFAGPGSRLTGYRLMADFSPNHKLLGREIVGTGEPRLVMELDVKTVERIRAGYQEMGLALAPNFLSKHIIPRVQ